MRHTWNMLLMLAALLSACAPLTFSHEGRIDFNRIRSVYVVPVELSGDADLPDPADMGAQRYAAEALTYTSGFTMVTRDKNAETDVVLVIRLSLDEVFFDGVDSYEGRADFELRRPNGELVIADTVYDDADDVRTLKESLLDDVAHFFLRPYRF